ncbi:2,3-bisphosphoglycerate-independent phosphoglycerate mutase [Spiroplasma platyhelix]|uniref:2,3-bisphosphoglycerate-independent phosphoglycerate mutase n=1 Tax=Spiroplasma platyhelix PALS-1 TaxID=1276218 RepID=A0A846TQV3_9MOLU|nr:2,3-bisphosphoglycerate-independent phosphoglycerate mutase [Spiroplasma platyhelix]MBE4704348.1 2,3-bisphosphoglycerate-independent phosphoglycerate mutase [Spiroplasma platyhelix PALS-1]NKE38720.1 2,3-bisphosphoglycerate-independent phosphoglycerate mutase [Spiroplasma platyhelix PALS-1]UJB28930.1 phosphoglyceromutase [Spiroplasma platyhelix PALS-1]
MKKQPILLAILDGFGIAKESSTNAISQAKKPNLDYFLANYPHMQLDASGLAVGLPEGQMGNSEVGHLHIGAGRTIYQSLTLVNKAIDDKSFFSNQVIKAAIANAKEKNSKLHIIGLLSDGGVHSHINHIFALLEYCAQEKFSNVYVHAILDGRDTKSNVAKIYLQQLIDKMASLKVGALATISGRYYAMDRDQRWERLQLAYDAMVFHKGASFTEPLVYIDQEYQLDHSDEFVMPAYNQNLENSKISDDDSIIFANFRPDRAIQLASALTNSNYPFWKDNSAEPLKNIYFISMMTYADSVKANGVIFPPVKITNGLGEWLSKNNLTQLRITETEKYAHVTYFFDGGVDVEYPLETRILIPSPKVKTYDLMPEMSAELITQRLEKEIKSDKYDVIILNFANSDMVGHTGNLKAAIAAIETIDWCLGNIYQNLKQVDGTLIITADHGNAEVMVDEQGEINKKHTSQPVPLIICKKGLQLKEHGSLANVAPTILDLLKIKKPEEMKEESLLKN